LLISREITVRELFHKLAQSTGHPALGLSLAYGKAGGGRVVLPHPPPQQIDDDRDNEYEFDGPNYAYECSLLVPEDPVPDDLWNAIMQYAACFSYGMQYELMECSMNVASYLFSMSVHDTEVSDAIAKIYSTACCDSTVYQKFQQLPPEMQRNRDVVLATLRYNGICLIELDRTETGFFRNDREFAIEGLKQNHFYMNYIDPGLLGSLFNDKELMMAFLADGHGSLFERMSVQLRNDIEVVQTALALAGRNFEHVPSPLKDEKWVVTAALQRTNDGTYGSFDDRRGGYCGKQKQALQFAHPKWQDDIAIVHLAIKNDGLAIKFASGRLRDDQQTVELAVSHNGMALQFASSTWLDNDAMATCAILQNGLAFEFVSSRLQQSEAMITLAVERCPDVLKFAPEWYCDNEAHILHATNHDAGIYCDNEAGMPALMYASKRLQDSLNFVLLCVKKHGRALQFASARLQDDDAVVLAAAKQDGLAWGSASTRIRETNKEVALLAAACPGYHIVNLVRLWPHDLDIARTAVCHKEKDYIAYLTEAMRSNPELAELSCRFYGVTSLVHTTQSLRNDLGFMTTIISMQSIGPHGSKHEIVDYIGDELKHNRDFVFMAMSACEAPYLDAVTDEFHNPMYNNDRGIVLLAINLNPANVEHVSEDLENDPEILAATACSAARKAVDAATAAAAAALKTKRRTGQLPPQGAFAFFITW
jgi:hypothetical protein